MLTILTIVLTAFLFIIIALIAALNKSRKEKDKIKEVKGEEIKQYFKERWENEQKKLDKEIHKLKVLEGQQQNILDVLYRKNEKLKTEIEERENHRATINDDLNKYRESKLSEIEKYMALEEKRAKEKFQREVKDLNRVYAEEKQKIHNKTEELRIDAIELIESTKQEKQKELEIIKKDLEDFRNRREAINKEILRQKEIEEKEDFYHIQITEDDKSDIELLRNIAPRLKHPEAVNKLIWTGYYQKPLAELRKRVAIEGSGIYKITRDKTGEVYIGQAVNISDRWSNHCRTALGVGTLASSTLHKCMAEDGPENFTFEVIEKVEKEKLKEKESYYIDFYDSKNYGLNSIRGVKNKTE